MPGMNRQPSPLKHNMQYLVRNILGFRIILGPGLRQTDAKRGRKRKNRCGDEKHPKCVFERPCSSQPCPARGKPGSLVPRQDLAVSWKMRTLQRQSPRNKTPKEKKKNSTVSLHQCSSGAHVRLYMCVHDVCSTVCRLYVSVHDARVSAGIQRSNQEIKCSVSLKLARTKTLELSGRNRPLRTQRGFSESLTRTVKWLAKGIKMLLCQPHSVSISV